MGSFVHYKNKNMKNIKLILLSLLIIGFSFNSFSQKDKDGKGKSGKLGIRFGSQTSNIHNGSSRYADNLSTFYIGVVRTRRIVPLLKYATGIEYFQSGTKVNNENAAHLHYISLPVNLRLKLGPVVMLGGIAPSFKIVEKWEVAGEKITPSSDLKANWFDAPVFIGGGFKFLMLSIEARYYWGTTNLYETVSDGTYKNRYFQIGLGIRI